MAGCFQASRHLPNIIQSGRFLLSYGRSLPHAAGWSSQSGWDIVAANTPRWRGFGSRYLDDLGAQLVENRLKALSADASPPRERAADFVWRRIRWRGGVAAMPARSTRRPGPRPAVGGRTRSVVTSRLAASSGLPSAISSPGQLRAVDAQHRGDGGTEGLAEHGGLSAGGGQHAGKRVVAVPQRAFEGEGERPR